MTTDVARQPGSAGSEPAGMPTLRTRPFDPPDRLAELRREGPVSRLRYPDGHLGWLVTDYAVARAILADQRFSARSEFKRVPVARPSVDPFYGRAALPGWFLDMDAPDHTRFRRLLAGHFTVRRAEALTPRVERIVVEHLDAMAADGGPCDLVEKFALPIPSMVICELLGVPYAERAEFQRNSATLFSLEVTADEANEAMSSLDALLLDLVRRHRQAPRGDLLGALGASGELSDQDITGVGVLLLTAGHETVASMLSLGTFALLCHPQQLRLLRDGEIDVTNAVDELLRYLSIFHFGVPRTPLEDVEIGGVLMSAGESVTVSLPAANRDPARFTDPDTLDLARPARGHLAFGFGMHQCIGQNLARIQMRIAYPALLRRFPSLRLAVPPQDVRLSGDMGFYGVHHLPVTW
ncbi:cytochrome P450 [Micromonospora okii]|uniref:cytochrome P450 n=1 Tax=Micromonospora okii TaxID=1182970 RepID=UPI001E38CC81|nr:cytochrome P450 [Micromonospora okii]